MDDNLFSLCCQNCGNSLLSALAFNPMFLHKADCPYCSNKVRLARLPVILITVGLITSFVSIYSLVNELENISLNLQIIGSGLGLGFFLFGILFLRFVSVKIKMTKKDRANVHLSNTPLKELY